MEDLNEIHKIALYGISDNTSSLLHTGKIYYTNTIDTKKNDILM